MTEQVDAWLSLAFDTTTVNREDLDGFVVHQNLANIGDDIDFDDVRSIGFALSPNGSYEVFVIAHAGFVTVGSVLYLLGNEFTITIDVVTQEGELRGGTKERCIFYIVNECNSGGVAIVPVADSEVLGILRQGVFEFHPSGGAHDLVTINMLEVLGLLICIGVEDFYVLRI